MWLERERGLSLATPTFKTLSFKQSLSKMISVPQWDISLEQPFLVELKSTGLHGVFQGGFKSVCHYRLGRKSQASLFPIHFFILSTPIC